MNQFVNAAVHIAEKAGSLLKEHFNTSLHIEFKGRTDLVTEMDKKSEEIITDFIKESFPLHHIVAEEGTTSGHDSNFKWYIDPLDGTTNYAHRVPWYAISIALYKDGEPLGAVIHNPAAGDMYTAGRGEGSFCNGKPIKVTDRADLELSVLSTGFAYYKNERPERILANLGKFIPRVRGLRRFGAAALDLAAVAAGIYDGFWEEGLKPWDTAAGILLIKEAGGKVTDYRGRKFDIYGDTITASNGKIHDKMIQLLRE